MRIVILIILMLLAGVEALYAGARRLTYDVKLGPFTIGKAVIEDLGMTEDNKLGRLKCFEVLVDTRQYRGTEKIYADPETLYPVRIERDISYFGKKERIIESYDQKKGEIVILKDNKGKMVLNQQPPVDNVFLLIIRTQQMGLKKIDGEKINLPTATYVIKINSGGKIRTKLGVFNTYLVSTTPAKIKLWFDKETGVPVRVAGAIPILPYLLSIVEVN